MLWNMCFRYTSFDRGISAFKRCKKAVVNRVLCVGLFIVAAAFIFQLTAGADHMTAKLLYDQGAQEKKGGGFILGGLLVVLYNLIGNRARSL